MKTNILTEKAVPVPARVKVIGVAAGFILLAVSVFVGMKTTSPMDMPVALANGEVIMPPWYVTIDGKEAVLLESREDAETVVKQVVEEYRSDPETIIDIRIVEDTALEKMEISNGDEAPDISTVEEAKDILLNGNDGESLLTVEVTREDFDIDIIQSKEEYKPEPSMLVGETKVETEGSSGVKKTIKRTISENGQMVQEEIVDEETIKEPVQEVILTGTKNYDGYGGGDSGFADEGVSYDPDATYDALEIPIPTVYVSSGYGTRWGRMHNGTDLALAEGSDIYAADDGTVYHAAYSGGYGNLIKIDHGNGMQTYYAHCSSIMVTEGQEVSRGEKIGLVGSTGNSTGPHLHLEVIINGAHVDPVDFMDIE